jgi:quercetin dioxygenase-like cupin family protein
MKTLRLFEQQAVSLFPGISFQGFAGENLMVSRLILTEGAIATLHAHPHEQLTIVLRGTLDFTLGEEHQVLIAGDVVAIPSQTPHGGVALQETELIEVFTPVREDLLARLRP